MLLHAQCSYGLRRKNHITPQRPVDSQEEEVATAKTAYTRREKGVCEESPRSLRAETFLNQNKEYSLLFIMIRD